MSITDKQLKALKDFGAVEERCEICHTLTWCVETMNADKPWRTDYLMPTGPRCIDCQDSYDPDL